MPMMLMMSKVTGGQGADDEVLGSAEFFDLSTQQWTMVIFKIIMMWTFDIFDTMSNVTFYLSNQQRKMQKITSR